MTEDEKAEQAFKKYCKVLEDGVKNGHIIRYDAERNGNVIGVKVQFMEFPKHINLRGVIMNGDKTD